MRDKAVSAYFKFRHIRNAAVMNTKVSKDGRKLRSLDLSDTTGDLNLVNENVKKWMDVTNIRTESLNVITSVGLGIQEKDKMGYDLLASNGDIKSITAYISNNLGIVSGYDSDSTEFIIEAFEMDKELAEHFRG